jgi:4-amino-4-deoxy-L-arabinose transferase-like glycosyltransferase
MKKIPSTTLFLIVIVMISLFGGVLAVLNTMDGPWGYSDPVVYISTARSLAGGQGFGYYEADAEFTYLTIQPPFYSMVLSVLALFKLNLVAGARWVNIAAFIASIFIAGWIFFRYSRVPALGIIASALMCAFPHMLVMFISAYTEPLFILLFFSGGLCLLGYLKKNRPLLLLLSALLIGLTPVTRYVGIALVIAGGLSVWLFSSGKAWSRIKQALLFFLVSGLPILIWFIWVYFSDAHTIGGRSLEVDWGGLAAQFKNFRGIFMDTVWKWFPFQSPDTLLRYRTRFVLSGIGLILIFGLSLYAERRLRKDGNDDLRRSDLPIFAFFGLSCGLLLMVIIATYLLTFPTIDIDNRTLLPLYVSGVMGLFGAMALWQAAWFKGRLLILQVLPWLLAGMSIIWYIPQMKERMEFYLTGTGLTAYKWDHSRTIEVVRSLPDDQPVISNDWELLLLWTGRPIHGFWNTFPTEPPQQTTAYGTDPRDGIQTLFCEQGAALVIFNDFRSQYKNHIDTESMVQIPNLFEGLSVLGTYSDGTIYLCP